MKTSSKILSKIVVFFLNIVSDENAPKWREISILRNIAVRNGKYIIYYFL